MAGRIDVILLIEEAQFLERFAERHEISLKEAFGMIIEAHAEGAMPARRTSFKVRKTLLIDPQHLGLLDRLALRRGVDRSEACRRLIDQEMSGHAGFLVSPTRVA